MKRLINWKFCGLRRFVITLLAFLLLMLQLPAAAIAAPAEIEIVPAVTAEAAVVMNLDTGEVLYGKKNMSADRLPV